ncbi:hypothetical protein D020_2910 [Vibrio parahaemolyticus SBR10290]|nr:hypothetical protein VP10329_18895 [Vibrio parahaemolyticus 10329]EQL87574.1 hypothetical protein D052_3380 [Vibrio parahaemolyticus 10290]ESV68776.1 hypothetical protein D021_2065 [Vibrio parahaemolyticus 10296]ESW41720.1 hypothetical protein D022_4851 [Vibrio parahaemolyticus 12310]ETT15155.1 hypothetical protein D023_4769 [Vibrio parahaemolyticus 3256]ETX53560.1 hypothetical protein D020_2910 [Vibrio parahaemolyticus SBR10290]EVU21496.1 hypothetical protein D046_0045 [Vibrio parahaemoly
MSQSRLSTNDSVSEAEKSKPENDFHNPERFKIEVRNATKNTLILTLNILL